MKEWDVIVVGTGLSGLSLGALLASDGGRGALVLEKSAAAGGRVRVTEKDGFLLDYGIHALLHGGGGTLARIVRATGGRLRVRPAGMCLADNNRITPLLAESLMSQLFLRPPVTAADALKITGRLTSRAGEDKKNPRDMSLADWIEAIDASPCLSALLRAIGIGLFAVDDPADASAMECFRFLKKVVARGGALGYPAGGWRSVTDALAVAIESAPECELMLKTRVERITVSGGRATGVELDGGEKLKSKTVVWSAPLQELPAALSRGAATEDDIARLADLRATYGVCLDIALYRPVTAERRCIVTLDPPTLGWFVSNVEPSVAPRGRQLLTIFSPVPPARWNDRGFRDDRLAAARDVYFGLFPEIQRRLLWERRLDTLVNAARVDTRQTAALRPGPRLPGIDNLLLIGDSSAAPGFGGEIAAESALKAFKIISSEISD